MEFAYSISKAMDVLMHLQTLPRRSMSVLATMKNDSSTKFIILLVDLKK